METNYKKEDTAKIAAYFYTHSNEEILVDDIMRNSSAERLCVYPILFEMGQDGIIEVTEREPLGTPSKVRLLEKSLI